MTFMCAFWENITENELNRSAPGSSQLYPYDGDPEVQYKEGEKPYTWPAQFSFQNSSSGNKEHDSTSSLAIPVAPEAIQGPIWVPLQPAPPGLQPP